MTANEYPELLRTAEVMIGRRDVPDDARVRALQASVRRRDAVLAAISYAATRFLDTADWDRDIRDVLGRLGDAAEVSRVYLFERYSDLTGTPRARMRAEWSTAGLRALCDDPAMADFDLGAAGLARWESLERGDVVHGPLAAMPTSERDFFARLGLRSVAAMPVFAGDSWWGYLGFADDLTEREWSRTLTEALQAAAATLGAAVYRKGAEDKLLESEACFRRLSEAAFEGVVIHDQGIVLEANSAFGRIFGYDADEMVGKNILDLVATPAARRLIQHHMMTGSEASYEVTGRRKDGGLIIAEISGRATSYQGKPARVATIHDVTARKHAEEALHRREKQLAEAQAVAHLGSWVWDIANNELSGSDELYRIYGFDPSTKLAPGSLLERVHPDDAALVRGTIDRAVKDGAAFMIEHRIVRSPTDIRRFHVEGRVVADAAGVPLRIIGVGQDVTERYEAEVVARRLMEEQAARSAAETAERRAAFLAEASRVLGASFDYQTTLATLARLSVPSLADFCSVSVAMTDSTYCVVGIAHIDPALEALVRVLTTGAHACGPWIEELRATVRRGEVAHVDEITDEMLAASYLDAAPRSIMEQLRPRACVTVPLRAGERVVGTLDLFMAESNRRYDAGDVVLAEELGRRAALAVENARLFNDAQQATLSRDQMLGVVAHDLRNPLSTMLMASSLLAETLDADSPAQRQVAMLHRAGERMNRLIQDLLDVKRMESGHLSVDACPLLVATLLTESADGLRPLAAAAGLELRLELPPDLPRVSADRHRMHQVLSNLIGNAIKFTLRGGKITLRADVVAHEVRVAVTDSGPGIPAEQLPHIFGQFWQGARTDRRGIGLGLAIAKGIVEAHHGRIWVESTLGSGSTFFFTLPAIAP
jgi:PAS domain S-box-containing protein